MSDVLLRELEPRLTRGHYIVFHSLRLTLLIAYLVWLVGFSDGHSQQAITWVTAALLLVVIAGWFYTQRAAKPSLVIELDQHTLRFALNPSDKLQSLPLAQVQRLSLYRNVLLFEGQGISAKAIFPAKYRHCIGKIQQLLQQTQPHIQQLGNS